MQEIAYALLLATYGEDSNPSAVFTVVTTQLKLTISILSHLCIRIKFS